MTAPMTPERLAEIRAEDARYSEHPYGEEILESWRDGLTRHQMSGERAILDRRDLLAEVDRLRAQVADAWDEGARAEQHRPRLAPYPPNPYRAAACRAAAQG